MYVCTLLTSYVSQFEMNRLTNTQMKQICNKHFNETEKQY